MEHPYIARVFEVGIAVDGRPWFSMEVVRGEPLTRWCDARRVSVKQRVALLERACLAIHHAHQRGVLHRDVKPSNVLVGDVDGEPTPKVIDFGLSVAADVAADETPDRGRSMGLGTPLYMAPEQSDRSQVVDARADVYALGALLTELLAGEPPIRIPPERDSVLAAVLLEVAQAARRRPTELLADSRHFLAALASKRSTTPRGLRRAVTGDLDAIAARATALAPSDRYETVLELARDLRAHLEHRPIAPRRSSALYRLRCLIRRRVVVTAAAAAVALILAAGTTLMLRSHLASLRAEAAARDSARDSEEVGRFLQRMILAPHPSALGRDVSMLDVLNQAEQQLARNPPQAPLTEARIRHALGGVLLGLGEPQRAASELNPRLREPALID